MLAFRIVGGEPAEAMRPVRCGIAPAMTCAVMLAVVRDLARRSVCPSMGAGVPSESVCACALRMGVMPPRSLGTRRVAVPMTVQSASRVVAVVTGRRRTLARQCDNARKGHNVGDRDVKVLKVQRRQFYLPR